MINIQGWTQFELEWKKLRQRFDTIVLKNTPIQCFRLLQWTGFFLMFFPTCHMLKSMVKLYKNDLKGNKNLLWVSGSFQLLRVQVTKGKITVHVWRKFGRNQLNFWFELAWGSSLRGFVLCHNLLKESMLSNATKKMLVL